MDGTCSLTRNKEGTYRSKLLFIVIYFIVIYSATKIHCVIYIYIYIYICLCVCVCVCVFYYIMYGGQWNGNETIRCFLSVLTIPLSKHYSTDTQHTACTNTQYHAIYLTGDPRSCSYLLHSAGWSSRPLPRTRPISVGPRRYIMCRATNCRLTWKTHPSGSTCNCTHSPAYSSTCHPSSYNTGLMETAETWYILVRCWCEVYCAVPFRRVEINCASDVLCCYFVLKCVLG